MKTIKLTESELKERITKTVNEALQDEGFMDFLKGAGKNVGSDIANGAKAAWNKGKQAAANTAQNVKNYADKVKTAGQMSSMNADNQKIAQQLQQWYQKGVFGDNKSINVAVSTLVNALNKKFNDRFGEGGNAHR